MVSGLYKLLHFLLSNVHSPTFSVTFSSIFSLYIYIEYVYMSVQKTSGQFCSCNLSETKLRTLKYLLELVCRYVTFCEAGVWGPLCAQEVVVFLISPPPPTL